MAVHPPNRPAPPNSQAGTSEWDLNDAGRCTAMTLLSRMHGWGARWLRLVLWVFRHFLRVRPLRELSFIHFAHWSVLDGLATQHTAGARTDRYLLFESNFNGSWNEYIEAFSLVVGQGIETILVGCEGFPGLMPVRGFKPFIENHEFVTDHYYSAYPDASATMIRAALELREDMVTLRRLAARSDDARFARAWQKMMSVPRVQANLAGQARTHPGILAYLRQLFFARKNAGGSAYAFLALAPVRSGEADALRCHLRCLPRHAGSPLATVPGTHFGRWVVLDRVFHDGWPERHELLDPTYLLFTAVFDATGRDSARDYVDRLVSALDTGADAIWGKCQDWPEGGNRRDRVNYLLRHRRDADFLFAAYSGSVDEVRRSLAERDFLVEFARRAQTVDPQRLRAEFRAAAADLDPSAGSGDGP